MLQTCMAQMTTFGSRRGALPLRLACTGHTDRLVIDTMLNLVVVPDDAVFRPSAATRSPWNGRLHTISTPCGRWERNQRWPSCVPMMQRLAPTLIQTLYMTLYMTFQAGVYDYKSTTQHSGFEGFTVSFPLGKSARSSRCA